MNDGRALREQLKAMPSGRFAELRARWFWQELRVVVDAPYSASLVDPFMPYRLRGALGRVLRDSASTSVLHGQPCCFSPPCALDVFYGQISAHVAAPFVPFCFDYEGRLGLGLRVLGLATEYISALQAALVCCVQRAHLLMGHEGLKILQLWVQEDTRNYLTRLEHSAPLIQGLTAFALRRAPQERMRLPFDPLFMALTRLKRLAPWCEVNLDIPLPRKAPQPQGYDMIDWQLRPTSLESHIREKGKTIMLYLLDCSVLLPPQEEEALIAFAMAAPWGLAANPSFGFGQYRLSLV